MRCIKKNCVEFTIVSNEIQYIVIRTSKVGWTEGKCIAMDKLAQEDQSYRLSFEEYERYQKTLVSHTKQIGQECADETPIKLPNSSRIAVSTENQEKNDQNQSLFNSTKGGTRLLFPVLHGGIGIKLVDFFFSKKM